MVEPDVASVRETTVGVLEGESLRSYRVDEADSILGAAIGRVCAEAVNSVNGNHKGDVGRCLVRTKVSCCCRPNI